MTSQPTAKIWWLSWGLVLMPLLMVKFFLTLGLHAYIGLGHWPVAFQDSYRSRAFDIHAQVVLYVAVFTIFFAPPLWLIALCFRRLRISKRIHLLQAATCIACWGFALLLTYLDPWRFLDWLGD